MRFGNVFLWFGVICLDMAGSAFAHDDADNHEHPPLADEADVYRPSLRPDRIVLSWQRDPATTQSVTWRTSVAIKRPVAEIAEAGAGPDFVLSARRVEGAFQPLLTNLGPAHFHTVEFAGLAPSTKYAYRVGDGVNWSEWFHFSTASDRSEPFSFVYFGDAQNDVRSMWSRVIREAYGDAPDLKFFLHAGDLINRAESDGEWGQWFAAGKWLNAMIPSIAVPGNHEQARTDVGRRLSHHWRPQFAFPLNGPDGLEESCYTMEYQGVRFIALNSNEKQAEQAVWLEEVLSENSCRWVICTFHHPIFSTGRNRDNSELRQLWKPIIDRYRVDLVLQGHDHTYGRTGLVTPLAAEKAEAKNESTGVNTRSDATGTVYVVSVSGPKMYSLQRYDFMKRQAENTQLYQIIHIAGDELHYEARTAVGELYDAFTLKKQDGTINEMIEQVPDTPERVKPVESDGHNVSVIIDKLMQDNDSNHDSKLTREEVPPQYRDQFGRVDADKDGAVTPAELRSALSEK